MTTDSIEPAEKPRRVFIVDDHPVAREGLATLLNAQRDFQVCGEAEDVPSALANLEAARADVLIVDLSLKSGHGIDLVKRIRARGMQVPVLIWSMFPESTYAERALHAGAQGYIHKGQPTREILEAIRAVASDKLYFSDALLRSLAKRLAGGNATARSPVASLSDRELETFELIGQGKTTEQIAAHMHVSPKTVETYRIKIKRKLNVKSLTELVQQATRWFLDQP